MRGARRGFAVAIMAAGAMISASSCVGLFELDGYAGVAPELCELLRTCYGEDFYADCLARVTDRLRDADEATRAAYLQTFADDRCLLSCTAARRCLDEAPLCDGGGSSCAQDEHCCGFLVGQSACGNGNCCASDGIACAGNTDCCDSPCEQGICGGTACLVPGENCENDFECCTEICLRGQCSENTCLPDGAECVESAECCNGFCDDKVCRQPECKPEGQPCDDPNECCGGFCVRSDASDAGNVCSFAECLPTNAECEPDSLPCCSGECDPNFGRCTEDCVGVGEACDDAPCCGGTPCQDGFCGCLPDNASCKDSAECCNGTCSANLVCDSDTTCNPSGSMCNGGGDCCSKECFDNLCCASPQCHDPCVAGAPLSPTCQTNGQAFQCLNQVCLNNPACCCRNWSQTCINDFAACRMMACPVPVDP